VAERPATTQLLLSLLSASDTILYQVATELRCSHELQNPDDALDALACAIVEQARSLRILLRLYAEQKNALHRQRRR